MRSSLRLCFWLGFVGWCLWELSVKLREVVKVVCKSESVLDGRGGRLEKRCSGVLVARRGGGSNFEVASRRLF